ncbi:MAG TPA: ADP-ribosylglycohydrolase family protein [Nostocaceae cyanobacterium]|nr:ADP-ribosylglycohydrolase family protein [Nostocaceae cyanobacterium]
MRYSLVSRFRGAFLGAFLGECIASQEGHDINLGRLAVISTNSLIRLGRLDINDWLEHRQLGANNSWGEIILATLPVALFFHESPIKLKQNLLQVLKIWGQDDPILQSATLAFGYAIAQSLVEKLHPFTLIPQTIEFLEVSSNSLTENLLKVNNLLEQSASLEIAQDVLNQSEKLSYNFALSFYCFLSTLEDFRLAVLRATHQDSYGEKQAISTITAALSGTYNSTAGLPVSWQVLFSPKNSPAWGLNSFSQMLELSDALVAVWSGLYELTPNQSYHTTAKCPPSFAAPRVIRPR